ncbi:MAG: hypothetical protein LBT71_08485 [Azoarcus sp.]|jgi:hypothetical protein|nr:hypothetical protein [Azoarcus sp.]
MNASLIVKFFAAAILPLCAVWNALPAAQADAAFAPVANAAVEWPATWRGQVLRPMALTSVEQRFARGFPGRIARLTDGRDVLVWRYITHPTRMLHPASDCYRALGWRIADEHLEEADGDGKPERWRCFIAERDGVRLRVCERIEDALGTSFTDTSAWYWSAITGQSAGPWHSITVASAL